MRAVRVILAAPGSTGSIVLDINEPVDFVYTIRTVVSGSVVYSIKYNQSDPFGGVGGMDVPFENLESVGNSTTFVLDFPVRSVSVEYESGDGEIVVEVVKGAS